MLPGLIILAVLLTVVLTSLGLFLIIMAKYSRSLPNRHASEEQGHDMLFETSCHRSSICFYGAPRNSRVRLYEDFLVLGTWGFKHGWRNDIVRYPNIRAIRVVPGFLTKFLYIEYRSADRVV